MLIAARLTMARRGAIVAVVCVALIGAACSDDSGGNASNGTETTGASGDPAGAGGAVAAEAYVAAVCAALGDWAADLDVTISALGPDVTRAAVVPALEDLEASIGVLRDEVSAAGVPDVTDGEQISANLLSAVDTVATAVGEATDLADGLTENVEDNLAISVQIDQALQEGFTDLLGLLLDVPPPLAAAFASDPGCASIGE